MSYQHLATSVEAAACLLAEHPEFDDETLATRLQTQGLDASLCERLVAFVPLAFGRVFLQPDPPRFSDAYLIPGHGESDPPFRGRLSEEPIFVAALAVAQQWLASGASVGLQTVASHSAEVHAVRQLARPGASLASIVLTEPVLVRLEAPTRKPWWKFW